MSDEVNLFAWTAKPPVWIPCKHCGIETLRETCGHCDDELIRKDEDREAARRAELNNRARIPGSYRWTWQDAELVAKRVSFTGNLNNTIASIQEADWVVLQGPAGAGKTTLAICAAHPIMARVHYVDAYQLARAQLQHAAGKGEADAITDAKWCPHLLLDDLGGEPKGATSCVPDVIFHRHAEGLPTWITTGFTTKQIADAYGDGIARRVFERALLVKLGKAAG